MAALTGRERSGTLSANAVDLMGAGWSEWRGRWRGGRVLVERDGSWALIEENCETARWPTFAAAAASLWESRRVRDRSPFLVGWLSYEESAKIAGGLPSHGDSGSVPGGWWLVEPAPVADGDGDGGPQTPPVGNLHWSLDGAGFCRGVESIRELIAAGDVYQVNLCRRATVDGASSSLAPFAEAAVWGGAPPYLARVHCGSTEILCASMELLLRRRGRSLETRPIKGTRRRGQSPEEDGRLVSQLENDPKERAELAMVVDLERNDLGRICETGSVEVRDPGTVHSYASVHHLVARVTGRGRRDLEWWELLGAMIPGGSITGCPKIAAMKVIRDLEPVPRGPFTGALGVVAGDGDLELALPIRTAWRIGSTVEFGAGCGIVWQSDSTTEEEESRLKVARWLDLVGGGA